MEQNYFEINNFYSLSEEVGCSHFEYGKYAPLQPKFECSICLHDSICKNCIIKCHRNCKTNYTEEPSHIKTERFVCKCATRLSHEACKNFGALSLKETSCNLISFDLKLNVNYKFDCMNHGITLCSFCYLNCHSSCNVRKTSINEIKNFIYKNESCNCNNLSNHQYSNQFIFSTDLNAHKKATEIHLRNNYHVLNILLETNLIEEIGVIINKFLVDHIITQAVREILNNMEQVFLNKEKFPGSFHPRLLDILSYESLINFLINFQLDKEEDFVMYMKLVNIMYSLHIKTDFSNLSFISVSDYANSFIEERISIRNSMYDLEIHPERSFISNKYCISGDSNSSNFKTFIFRICKINKMKSNDFTKINSFLKLIKFCLKYCIFNKLDFVKLIDSFHYFILYLIEDSKNREFREIKDRLKFDVIAIEIIFMMSVYFNDLVIENHIQNEFHSKQYENFVHFKNETSTKILQMISNVGWLIFTVFEERQSESSLKNEKFEYAFNLFDETIKIFTVSDNIYLKQVKDIKKFWPKYKMTKGDLGNTLRLSVNKHINSLKDGLNGLKFNYYTSINVKGEDDDIIKNFVAIFKMFLDNFSNSFSHENSGISSNFANSKLNMSLSRSSSSFMNKLFKDLKKSFKFLNHFNTQEFQTFTSKLRGINIYVHTLINFLIDHANHSNVSDKKESIYAVELVFKFLSLSFLTRDDLKKFLTGNSLTMILKLFKNYKLQVLKFVFLIVKVAKIYEVDLSNHIILEKIKRIYSELWISIKYDKTSLENKPELNADIDSEFFFSIIFYMKIINKLSDYYSLEKYNKIKSEIVNFVLESKSYGLLNIDKFKSILNEYLVINKSFLRTEKTEQSPLSTINKFEISERQNLILKKPEKNDYSDNLIADRTDHFEKIELMNLTSEINIENPKSENKKNSFDDEIGFFEFLRPKTNYELLINFYFSFFKLVSANTLFVRDYTLSNFEKEEYLKLVDFVSEPIDCFFNIQGKLNLPLSINKRRILFNTIRALYFIDFLDNSEIPKKANAFSNSEYEALINEKDEISGKLKNSNDIMLKFGNNQSDLNRLSNKLNLFKKMKNSIIYFSQELNQLKPLKEKTQNYKNNSSKNRLLNHKFHSYIVELLLSIKFISEYIFIEEDFWSGVNGNLIKLANILFENFKFLMEFFNKNISLELVKIKIYIEILNSKKFTNITKIEISNIISEIVQAILPDEINYKIFGKIFNHFDKYRSINFITNSSEGSKNFNLFTIKCKSASTSNKLDKPFDDKVNVEIKENYSRINLVNYRNLKYKFLNEFSDTKNSTFIQLIIIKYLINKIDYTAILIKLFISMFSQHNTSAGNNFLSIKAAFTYINLINKMMFYDTDGTHSEMYKQVLENKKETGFDDTSIIVACDSKSNLFFRNVRSWLINTLKISLSFSKNYFNDSHKFDLLILSNELIHFYQLLSENRNYSFHNVFLGDINIYPTNLDEKREFSVFKILVFKLEEIKKCMFLESNFNVSLPYDTLLITLHSIVECFIEYIECIQENHVKQINETLEYIFKDIFTKIFHCQGAYAEISTLQRSFSPSVSDKWMNKISEKIQDKKFIGNNSNNIKTYAKSLMFKLFISFFENEKKPDVKFSFKHITIEQLYKDLFINFSLIINKYIKLGKLDKKILEFSQNKFSSHLKKIYVFNQEINDDALFDYCLNLVRFIKSLYINHDIPEFFKDLEEKGVNIQFSNKGKPKFDQIPKTEIFYDCLMGYKFYNFLEKLIIKIDVSYADRICTVFFRRPIITYHLTKETKTIFLKNVNRENVYSKLYALIKSTDYFIFEMIFNFHSTQSGT